MRPFVKDLGKGRYKFLKYLKYRYIHVYFDELCSLKNEVVGKGFVEEDRRLNRAWDGHSNLAKMLIKW